MILVILLGPAPAVGGGPFSAVAEVVNGVLADSGSIPTPSIDQSVIYRDQAEFQAQSIP
jgi:hypothetical protein